MTYTYSTQFGDGIYLAPCLQRLCWEIAHHPEFSQLTNLGEIGDTSHQSQGYSSDHNPFIIHQTRGGRVRRLVRAIDLGGDPKVLLRLRHHLNMMYATGDKRLWEYGYMKGPDDKITSWVSPPAGRIELHVDSGDEGHLHISVTQADGYHPSPNGWVRALAYRRDWGLVPGKRIRSRIDNHRARRNPITRASRPERHNPTRSTV